MSKVLPFPVKKKQETLRTNLNVSNILDFLVQYITISYNLPKVLSEVNEPPNIRQNM